MAPEPTTSSDISRPARSRPPTSLLLAQFAIAAKPLFRRKTFALGPADICGASPAIPLTARRLPPLGPEQRAWSIDVDYGLMTQTSYGIESQKTRR